MFGQFKGFTLSALPAVAAKPAEPTKPAPPPPSLPTVAIKTNIKPAQRSNTLLRNNFLNGPPSSIDDQSTAHSAPALPPMNPGCTARPLISSPVLAATTCTSMELIAAKVPTRPAPDIPVRPRPEPALSGSYPILQKPARPTSTPLVNVVVTEPEKKVPPQERTASSTLNRIASMLRPGSGVARSNSQPQGARDDKKTNSLPRSQHQRVNKVMDKEILRNLEISNPIPQKEIELATQAIPVVATDGQEKRPVVMRAQSMRDPKISARPAIHTFGSMRQANPAKRPTSIPASARPTSPPPVPPVSVQSVEASTESVNKIPGLPGYQNPPVKAQQKAVSEDTYDDCMNLVPESSLGKIMEESPSSDNIYAVIEESVPEKNRKKAEPRSPGPVNEYKCPKPIDASSTVAGKAAAASDTMGLLSEIVSEISNRNFDSIYSTSTLARKKREKEEAEKSLGSNSSINTYANSSNHYKSPGSVYSNAASGKFNSASSTTSSGYLSPSALNVPQRVKDNPKLDVTPEAKQVNDNKLSSLNSDNPNINDAISKALGMKPPEARAPAKPGSSLQETKKHEISNSTPEKPPLSRTKTPPSIAKTTGPVAAKQTGDFEAKSSDGSLKSVKQSADSFSGFKAASRQGSDTSLRTPRQGSDSSLRSNGSKVSSPTKSNPSSNKSGTAQDKRDSVGSLKAAPPASPGKEASGKLSNSPDLVSSCSNAILNGSKTSPDVTLGGNSTKITGTAKIPAAPKCPNKTPSMPPKPSSIMTKAATFADRKKSATSPVSPTTSLAKSLSLSAKDSGSKSAAQPGKFALNANLKTGEKPVQKAAGSKSNVASLQQKFEANKASNPPARTVSSVNKKLNIGRTTTESSSLAAKK